MTRKPRDFHPGGIYHITHRGHNHQYILADDLDKVIFLDKLKKILQEHTGHLLYYVLMNNHYHLLLEMQSTPIDLILHRLHTSYGRYFSLKNHSTGAVFENRYQSQTIDHQKYLYAVIKYIALNPIRAGLTERINDYRWSAHLDLAQKMPGFVNKSRLYEKLGTTTETGRAIYLELIQNALKEPLTHLNPGEYQFKRKISELENLLASILHHQGYALTIQQIVSGKRSNELIRARQEFAREANQKGYSYIEIAAVLQVSTRSVRYWCQNGSDHDDIRS